MKYDVVVVGAGPAGIAASLVASRNGAKTALLERYGCVGGCIVSAYVHPFMGSVVSDNVGREIEREAHKYIESMSFAESAKVALAELLHKSGVDVYLQTQLVSAVTEEHSGAKTIKNIKAVSRCGEMEFTADAYIDATGDGDLSNYAGAEYEMGRSGDKLVQPVSIMFTIEGIAPEQTLICEHEKHYTVLENGKEYLDLCNKACENGILPPTVNIVRLYNTGRIGERMVNSTQANHVNPLDPLALFNAEYELRMQIKQIVSFLRENIPGFENIRVNGSATTVGVRESRRIIGDYILQGDDITSGRTFDDAIVRKAWFPIDIHNPDGVGQAESNGLPVESKEYDIPYRCLTPKHFDNLLTSGRCISGTHRAHASYRVMRICMATGHAAGYAAAQMSKLNIKSREVHFEKS